MNTVNATVTKPGIEASLAQRKTGPHPRTGLLSFVLNWEKTIRLFSSSTPRCRSTMTAL
jgi:hypothetical protein